MNGKLLEKDLKKYNQIKTDLLKMSKCIECCEQENERVMYQNVTMEYSKELKQLQKALEATYGVKLCSCYKVEG
ncbi:MULTISPECIES: hypothetical protein [Bacillus]|uniref:Uncharacterized protein n=2 Tax=Bacillus cereus group TaxID=86661 RepID=A0A2C1DRW8_BACCE|nr:MULTISPECIES: hypothetical protein [Bacillus cereus group]OFD69949.1 hypothetical protein BWGOE8_58720 [Bacillus mycoides]OFD69960.1 hypothetical protein BWGOE9_57960 [Bacillus mycoides]OFD70586.1 hypothetical protein BWGOE10_57770 [Bacillus mycoides]PGT02594.1 hypothetical protein COD09_11685 [Bacillus cereus]